MEKKDFKKLAMLGITVGCLAANQTQISANELANFDSQNYLAHGCGSSCGSQPSSRQSGGNYVADRDNFSQDSYQTSYPNTNSSTNTNPSGTRNYQNPSQNNQYSPNTNTTGNRNYQNSAYNDPMDNSHSYSTPPDSTTVPNQAAPSSGQLTESQLLQQLNPQTKAVYQSLSSDGKAIALKFANRMSDKNEAVRLAAKQDHQTNPMKK